ncbi:Serine/threonine protein phosphatase 7 long form isogeny [Arachis hypogaea]|nr:Serine/threonine protein phosphatase 7 long form isogeny [Arachis hypogaea]
MEMVYTSRRVSTKWDHGIDTNHFIPGTKEMQHVKLGVHELDHYTHGKHEMGDFTYGTHEMDQIKCVIHELGISWEAHTKWPSSSVASTKWGGGQSKQQLQFPYEHALGESEAIYCWVVSLKHIKGGCGREGDQNEENLNRLDEFHIYAHLHVKPARVLTLHGTLVDVFSVDEADPSMEIRRQMLEPYLRRAGFYYASLIKCFEYDNPMISALVERWRPETHTSHLPWGECTITLEDVAMQVGLPIDGEPVSGTLKSWSKFHQRDIWQWCEELLGEVPDGHVGTTKYNIKLKWLRSRLQQMPFDSPEEALVRYARYYIMYLLGGVLLPDKANNTVHVRYLPLQANYEAISTYSWGSAVLCWLYRAMCLATDYNVEGMSGCHTLLMSWIYFRLPFWAPDVTSPYMFPLATTWAGKRGKNDYAEQRLQRHRLRLDNFKVDEGACGLSWCSAWDFHTAVVPLILFRWIEIVNIDRVMRQFGGKQGPPNPPLNIDTFHRQSARNDDGWWPIRLQTWFEVWANRRTVSYRLEIDRADTLHPSHDYYRLYCSRTKRFLSPPEAFHDPRGDDIPRGAPAKYGGPVVQLPAVLQDRRHHRSRRGRHQAVEADEMQVPDSPVPDPGQPFVAEDPFQSSTVHQYMPYNSTYKEGGSSQGAVHRT